MVHIVTRAPKSPWLLEDAGFSRNASGEVLFFSFIENQA